MNLIRPVASPIIGSRLNNNAAWWLALRAACKASVYTAGAVIATEADTTAEWEYDLPTGCDSITRYVTNEPGGRSGGSVAYADFCFPLATPVNKCLVFLGGHIQATTWDAFYCNADGSSIILRMLAAGWHVLAVDEPGYGRQPHPQIVVLNGTPRTVNDGGGHPYFDGFGDGGPNPNRIFTDHIIRAMTSITADIGITRFSLVGHSGGAMCTAILAACEDRFRVVHWLQGGNWAGAGSDTDIEGWYGNTMMTPACGGDSTPRLGLGTPALIAPSAAVANRITVVSYAPSDEYFGGSLATWQAWQAQVGAWLDSSLGAKLSLYVKTGQEVGDITPYHTPDPTQAAMVAASLIANG